MYTNAGMKIYRRCHIITLFTFGDRAPKLCEMFVYKHTETIEYVKKKSTFKEKRQTSGVENSRIHRIMNAKLLVLFLYEHEHIVKL